MLLTLRKKAATEAEAENILAQSFAFETPFGTPTVFIDSTALRKGVEVRNAFKMAVSEDPVFPRHWGSVPYGEKGQNLSRYYKDIFKNSGRFHPAIATALYNTACRTQFDADDFERLWVQDSFGEYSLVHRATQADGKRGYADKYDPEHYIDPSLNIVIASKHFENGRKYLADSLALPEASIMAMPGYNAQWGFFGLWHEYAHGAGAGEPQAEMMAAAACRKAFEDCSFLHMQADTRALFSVLQYDFAAAREQYYAMDEAIDFVMKMDQSVIESLSPEDVRELRFKKFERHDQSLMMVGIALERHGTTAFNECSLPLLKSLAAELVQSGAFPQQTREGIILRRFHLATRRLSVGTPAYITS